MALRAVQRYSPASVYWAYFRVREDTRASLRTNTSPSGLWTQRQEGKIHCKIHTSFSQLIVFPQKKILSSVTHHHAILNQHGFLYFQHHRLSNSKKSTIKVVLWLQKNQNVQDTYEQFLGTFMVLLYFIFFKLLVISCCHFTEKSN